MRSILVIRLSALGDFVLSFGPFAAIAARHNADHVTLLTTAPFVELAQGAPWFDAVVTDDRPGWLNLPGLLRLRRHLRGHDFVYDLQTSSRSSRYFALAGRPPWSGIAPGASHPHANPLRDAMHTIERQRDQLRMAGISEFPAPDLGFLREGAERFGLPTPYALLVPGAAPHRPAKRWPAEGYGAVAAHLHGRGIAPVVVGTKAEAPLAAAIRAACTQAIDLTGRTRLTELAALAGRAALAVGNDTGPMHLAAAMGAPCLVLFSGQSDPALTAPRGLSGNEVRVLRVPDLRSLVPDRVIADLPRG
jgi:ADP-heptose:LPS heptosyltransferase